MIRKRKTKDTITVVINCATIVLMAILGIIVMAIGRDELARENKTLLVAIEIFSLLGALYYIIEIVLFLYVSYRFKRNGNEKKYKKDISIFNKIKHLRIFILSAMLVYYALGIRYLQVGENEKAAQCFEESLGLESIYSFYYYLSSLAYLYLIYVVFDSKEKIEEIIQDYEKIKEKNKRMLQKKKHFDNKTTNKKEEQELVAMINLLDGVFAKDEEKIKEFLSNKQIPLFEELAKMLN